MKKKLFALLKYRDRYQILISFNPSNESVHCAVYIRKGDVELADFGGDDNYAISSALEYLDRITKGKREVGV